MYNKRLIIKINKFFYEGTVKGKFGNPPKVDLGEEKYEWTLMKNNVNLHGKYIKPSWGWETKCRTFQENFSVHNVHIYFAWFSLCFVWLRGTFHFSCGNSLLFFFILFGNFLFSFVFLPFFLTPCVSLIISGVDYMHMDLKNNYVSQCNLRDI